MVAEVLRRRVRSGGGWVCAAAAAGRVPRRGVRSSGSGACGAAVSSVG